MPEHRFVSADMVLGGCPFREIRAFWIPRSRPPVLLKPDYQGFQSLEGLRIALLRG
jgi:hypothetical protein